MMDSVNARDLTTIDAIATIPVKDLANARRFYEGVLGFEVIRTEGNAAVSYRSGKTELLVYQSQFAGSNQATAATWVVPDAEELVNALHEKGITFERYDFPGMQRKGDIHIAGHLKNAWFKDPDGNILSLVSTG
jgi:catechol 2,3-dioxygenase-like lactoylglutathione lyase family enzyme